MTDFLTNPTALVPTEFSPDRSMVTLTYGGFHGELLDPIPYQSSDEVVLNSIRESLIGGSIDGLAADPNPDLANYIVRWFPPNDRYAYSRCVVRPKTPFGK